MSGLRSVTREQNYELVRGYKRSACRLEALQEYRVPQEVERLAAFLEGRPMPPRPENSHQMIRDLVAAGAWIGRVHIVDLPLTDYLRFELACYPDSVAVGEDIRIARRDAHPGLADLTEEFLIIDDEIVLFVRYTADGQVIGYEHSDDPDDAAKYAAQRDFALAHAVPLDEFVASLPKEQRS
ncbi:MAG: DUF6879 family protein [Egibacteraceae bacterium]